MKKNRLHAFYEGHGMLRPWKCVTAFLSAAVLAGSGLAGGFSAIAGAEEMPLVQKETPETDFSHLADALLQAGNYAKGEAVVVVNQAARDLLPGDCVPLAKAGRRDIVQALAGKEDGGQDYSSIVSGRLKDVENRFQDSFQIFLVRDGEMTTGDLLEQLYEIPGVIMAEPNYFAGKNETDGQNGNDGEKGSDGEYGKEQESVSDGSRMQAGSEDAPAAIGESQGDLTPFQWYMTGDSGSVFSTPAAPDHAGYGLNVPGWNGEEENASGTVCIMDTGVDTTHPDLEEVFYTFSPEQQEKYNCGPHGVNVNTRTSLFGEPFDDEEEYRKDVSDHYFHGTHLAGIIGASWDQEGISGIAKGAKLLAVRVNDNDGMGQGSSDVLKGFEWLCTVAKEVNLKAVNVSLGSMQPQLIHTVMANRLGALGVNTVYASGNASTDLDQTIDMGGQNNSPYVIVVNAADMDGKKPMFSCYGQMSTDVFAPGTQILSTVPEMVEKRTSEGELRDTESRRRFFPEAAKREYLANGSIERFDQPAACVRFFDRCPVKGIDEDLPEGEARQIGSISSKAGFDDSFCYAVPLDQLPSRETEQDPVWMPGLYVAGQTMWIALPAGEDGSASQAVVRAALSDKNHITAGLTGVLCARKEADGTITPVPVDMRYDSALSSIEGISQELGTGLGKAMTASLSAQQWADLSVDLDRFVNEAAYYHSTFEAEGGNESDGEMDASGMDSGCAAQTEADDGALQTEAEMESDLSHPADPGVIDGLYAWEDGGQKYILLEFGIAKTEMEPLQSEKGSTELYFDNIAAGSAKAYSGAYETMCGTSMAAPCVTGSLAVIAKDEPASADMTTEELEQAAIERKAKLLAAVDYDEDLSQLCSTGGRLNLHGQSEFIKKAPIITDAVMDGSMLTVCGYFFGDSGDLYIDGKKTEALEWSDGKITADPGHLSNGMHEVRIVNEDEAVFRRLFASSMEPNGRRLYEKSWPLPLADERFMEDRADGFLGMAVTDGSLYVMAVYGLERAQALWRLDLAEKKWSRCADLPDAIHGRTMENSGFAISKGKLYCYSCREGLEPASSPAICAYDPASDSWEEIPMEKLCRSAQLFAIEDELFLVTDIRMEEEDEAGEPGTEAEEAENAGTEAEEAECSGTGAEEAEDAGTEAEEAKGSGTETEETEEDTEEYARTGEGLGQYPFPCFYRVDLDNKTVVPVDGNLPEGLTIYSTQTAASAHAVYLLGSTYDENYDEIFVLLKMTWDSGQEEFVQEDLSQGLPALDYLDLLKASMAGFDNGIALICTDASGQDTFILEDDETRFRALEQVSCYNKAFQPIAACGDGWLYVLAMNATEPEVVYLRSTRFGADE